MVLFLDCLYLFLDARYLLPLDVVFPLLLVQVLCRGLDCVLLRLALLRNQLDAMLEVCVLQCSVLEFVQLALLLLVSLVHIEKVLQLLAHLLVCVVDVAPCLLQRVLARFLELGVYLVEHVAYYLVNLVNGVLELSVDACERLLVFFRVGVLLVFGELRHLRLLRLVRVDEQFAVCRAFVRLGYSVDDLHRLRSCLRFLLRLLLLLDDVRQLHLCGYSVRYLLFLFQQDVVLFVKKFMHNFLLFLIHRHVLFEDCEHVHPIVTNPFLLELLDGIIELFLSRLLLLLDFC